MKRVVLLLGLVLAAGTLAAAAGMASSWRGSRAVGDAPANRARAVAEAARLLALVQLPPGAARSSTEPAGDQHGLSRPSLAEVTPNLVDASAWWTTSATGPAVLAYVAAHLPPGAKQYTRGGTGGGTSGPVQWTTETFALPPVAGVLKERVMGVTVAALPHGMTGVRTDGEAIWVTPRPAWEQIPSGVRRVVFTARGADLRGRLGPASAPRLVTGAPVRRLVAFINAQEVVQPGPTLCPADLGASVSLRFIASNGRTLARATENPTGCASVRLVIGGRRGPPLDDDPTVTDELVRIGAVPVCAGSTLSPSASPPGRNGPIKDRLITFSFQNRSPVMCRLAGFPHLTAFDAAQRRIPLRHTNLGARIVRQEGVTAVSVLDPGQAASFPVTYVRCPGAPVVTSAQVVLPGVARRFRFAVGSARDPFAPCHGRVGVGNL
jgi:hypothetical protein